MVNFWLQCLRWALWRWERGGEAMLANAVPPILSLKCFECIYPRHANPPRLPAPSHRLPWARQSGQGGLRYLADLHAHNGLDYVDVASQRWGTWAGQPEVVLVIPSPPRDQAQPLIDDYVLEKGVYEIVVEVGTESDDEFMPTTITLRLVYDSAAGFEMHEIVR